jgi:hypothetical protein
VRSVFRQRDKPFSPTQLPSWPSPAELAAQLALRIEALSLHLTQAKPTNTKGSRWRFRGHGSLSITVMGPDCGSWSDFEGGQGGDALGLVAHLRGTDVRSAYHWALAWLGGSVGRALANGTPGSAQPARELSSTDDRVALGRRFWNEAKDPLGTPVEAYLASRGLALPPDAPLRFHPACARGAERLPAMLALMTDPVTGEPCGVHRTFLAPEGRGKASGQAKMMLGRAGVIRLVPDEDVTHGLGLAEGIETALSVMQVYGWRPVWAATSAGAIASFPVLPGIECITVFSDNDESGAGLKAANKCYKRWVSAGVEFANIPCPRTGDWNDMARRA